MDHDSADISGETNFGSNRRALCRLVPLLVSVCISCKAAETGTIVGPDMFDAVKAALGDGDGAVMVRPVQCLSVCKRPATVAVTEPRRLHVPVRRSADR